MRNKGGLLIGLILVVFGVLILLSNLDVFEFSFSIGKLVGYFWSTLFIILPAIAMHSIFFSGKSKGPGILVPAGILLIIGIVCQLSMMFHLWNLLWPGYIFSVAFGLFELYIFGGKRRGLLIPITILTGLSLVFFLETSMSSVFGGQARHIFVPILIVAIGLVIVFSGKKRNAS